jgi:hypothetical protein
VLLQLILSLSTSARRQGGAENPIIVTGHISELYGQRFIIYIIRYVEKKTEPL